MSVSTVLAGFGAPGVPGISTVAAHWKLTAFWVQRTSPRWNSTSRSFGVVQRMVMTAPSGPAPFGVTTASAPPPGTPKGRLSGGSLPPTRWSADAPFGNGSTRQVFGFAVPRSLVTQTRLVPTAIRPAVALTRTAAAPA